MESSVNEDQLKNSVRSSGVEMDEREYRTDIPPVHFQRPSRKGFRTQTRYKKKK